MSQFSFEPEVAEQASSEHEAEHTAAGPATLAMTVDDFSALEERILRAVNLVKRERMARAEAEERALRAEGKLLEQAPVAEQLQKEVTALRAERDHVRQRVERLLAQLDALEV